MSPGRARRAAWVALAVAVAALLYFGARMHGEGWIEGWLPRGRDAGAIAIFLAVYVVATVLVVPVGGLSLFAGAWLGPWDSFVVVSLGSTIGAALAFGAGRWLARPVVVRWIEHRPRWRAIDRAIERGGWRVVALLRLSLVVPYVVMNYVCAATAVRFWPYLLSSTLAMVPGSAVYVLAGHAGRLGLQAAEGESTGLSDLQWAGLGLALGATLGATWYLARLARVELATVASTPVGRP